MAVSNQLKNQHLLWRAAFGPMTENVNQLQEVSQKDLHQLLVKTSAKKPEQFNVASNLFDGLVKGVQDLGMMQKLSQDQRKMLRKQSVDDLKNLNLTWLSQMINSEAQLREKMSLFWHGHFACRVINIFFQQQLLNIIRENALGNFGDLRDGVALAPRMFLSLTTSKIKNNIPMKTRQRR